MRGWLQEGASFWSESALACTSASVPEAPAEVWVSSVFRAAATVAWAAPADDGGSPPAAYQVRPQCSSFGREGEGNRGKREGKRGSREERGEGAPSLGL